MCTQTSDVYKGKYTNQGHQKEPYISVSTIAYRNLIQQCQLPFEPELEGEGQQFSVACHKVASRKVSSLTLEIGEPMERVIQPYIISTIFSKSSLDLPCGGTSGTAFGTDMFWSNFVW